MFVWIVIYSKRLWAFIERNKVFSALVAVTGLITGGFFTEAGSDFWRSTKDGIIHVWQAPERLKELVAQNEIMAAEINQLKSDNESLKIELASSSKEIQPYTTWTSVPFFSAEDCVDEVLKLAKRRGYTLASNQHDGESVRFAWGKENYEVRCLVRPGNRITFINVAGNNESGADRISYTIDSELSRKFWTGLTYENLPKSFAKQHLQPLTMTYQLATLPGEMAMGIKLPDLTRTYFEEKGGIIDCTYTPNSEDSKLCGVEFAGMFASVAVWRPADGDGTVMATVNAVIDYVGDRYLWTPKAAEEFFLQGP